MFVKIRMHVVFTRLFWFARFSAQKAPLTMNVEHDRFATDEVFTDSER
jgi:hypothetical protein